MRRARRWLARIGLALAAALLLIVLVAALTPQGRAATRAALFVSEIVPGITLKPQSWLSRDPVAEAVSFPVPSGTGNGSLYRPPGDGRHPAVLLFLGVSPAGADDPRVVNLGDALARSGMVAMFYWSVEMAQERITPGAAQDLAAAVHYLRGRSDVDPERVRMGGFCVGASFVLIAASQPGVREHVRYINAFGPYYDMRELAVDLGSRSHSIGGRVERWEPDSLARRVFVKQMATGVPDARERAWLYAHAETGEDPPPGMSPEGLAVHALLSGVAEAQAREAVERLPAGLLAEMDAASPQTYVDGISTRVLLMHDRRDNLVPARHSRLLKEALEQRGASLYYTEFSFFQHMDPTRQVSRVTFAKESGRLFQHIYQMMRAAW